MPDDSIRPLIYSRSMSPTPTYTKAGIMENLDLAGGAVRKKGRLSWVLVSSYVSDWAILVAVGVLGYILGDITPNKRPFRLDDPNIAFPYTVKETVPVWLAMVCSVFAPIIIIAVICLVLVPGATVPRGTPKSLIWKRKLWELHAGWLGLALSIIASWIITNAMKNLFGKPRPDLLSRCQPDLINLSQYIVSPNFTTTAGQLVSAAICKNPDHGILDDGFRSYPSGHSSSASAGLIYLSLFIASKFAITIPFLAPAGFADAAAFAAFPSRTRHAVKSAAGAESYELSTRDQPGLIPSPGGSSDLVKGGGASSLARHNQTVSAVRRQAAAPPLYLLAVAILPVFASMYIAGSRWFDFRHFAFDILFGYAIGVVTSIFAFRYYHLPISYGAGWAWGPRSHDKAYWAGVGSFSYATDRVKGSYYRGGDEEEALGAPPPMPGYAVAPGDATGRVNSGLSAGAGSYNGGAARRPSPPTSRRGNSPPISRHGDEDTEYRGVGVAS